MNNVLRIAALPVALALAAAVSLQDPVTRYIDTEGSHT